MDETEKRHVKANGHADENARKAILHYPSNMADKGLQQEYE